MLDTPLSLSRLLRFGTLAAGRGHRGNSERAAVRGSVESYNTQAGKRYRIRFDLPPGADGQRRQRSRRGFTSKGEAERALRQALSASDVGSHVEVSRLTVGEYLFAWLEGHPVRETSRAAYRTSIRARLVPRLGGIRLQRLTTSDIDRAVPGA